MPDPAPPGILPMFLRGVTAEKYGFKTGEGVTDLVDSLVIPKEKIIEEITMMGVMSDFEPCKKHLDSYPADDVLWVIDKDQQYGEMFLLCYTVDAKNEFERKVQEAADAVAAQKRAVEEAEAARVAAEYARANVVYEDKPIEPRPWETETMGETEEEVNEMSVKVPFREPVVLEITRPKKQTGLTLHLYDRNSDVSGLAEWRAAKDPNFKNIVEADCGFQAAAATVSTTAQTTWNRCVNKCIQYESIALGSDNPMEDGDNKDDLLRFLEKATMQVEKALQQNETVDIFNETFQIVGDEEGGTGAATDNELKELKNFADPQYSKSKSLVAIDWLPKSQGMLAASAVRNVSFDQRAAVSGQTFTSYVLIWDFRQLVKPAAILKCNHEIVSFRFNPANQNIVAGACITGQVVIWDISAVMASAGKKGRGSNQLEDDVEDLSNVPIAPIITSSIDYSHKKPVSDVFWLPANTQINYRGQIVAEEHNDAEQHQLVTVSGDGSVFVWDTRYEEIAAEELKHIGRPKHVPVEKTGAKTDEPKLLWAPIFRAPLKRTEGIGEISLNKVCCSGMLPSKLLAAKGSELAGDPRSHLILGTEEGEVLFVDLCVAPSGGGHNDDDDGKEDAGGAREFVRWIKMDHSRPPVSIQQSPFFPDIVLTVSDWAFHIWQVGKDKPIYVSTNHNHYLTCGAWSPTRPSVVILSDQTGHLQVWDFTDTSTRSSAELKATHDKITSMEFMDSAEKANTNQQLLAIGDEVGTLHVYEMPRNLIRPVPKEKEIMEAFMAREWTRIEYLDTIPEIHGFAATSAAIPSGNADNEIDIDIDDEAADGDAAAATAAIAAPSGDGNELAPSADDTAAAARKAKREALKKEEEEFLRMEAMFVGELELEQESIPDKILSTMVQLTDKEKEKLNKNKGQ